MLMSRRRLTLVLALALLVTFLVPAPASAHPEACSDSAQDAENWWGRSYFATVVESVNIFAELFPSTIPTAEHAECLSQERIDALDDSAATLAAGGDYEADDMTLLANIPKVGPFETVGALNSDLAFWEHYAIQGNYNGFNVVDIRIPTRPRQVSQVLCPGSQNDVSVWRDLVITSTDQSRSTGQCDGVPQSAQIAASWEGIRIFDWSNPRAPELVTTVETDCGSHTHTILPERDRVLVYVSSYGPDLQGRYPDCQPPHDKISIVEIPLDNPEDARVIAEPVLFPDGGFPGIPGQTSATSGCHDITVYQAIGLAAGACMGEGVIMDISDPEAPEVISSVTDPNFAFWHSATFSDDGETVVFTDELFGGTGPTCNPTIGPERGADAFYDISDPASPVFASYFKIPRTQTNEENCVAHNGSLIPVRGRDLMVQAWYQGGISVIDFSNPYQVRELAWFDRPPFVDPAGNPGPAGAWSSYFYRGRVFSSEIQRGFDELSFNSLLSLRARRLHHLNAQTQEPLR
jgi:hypothetical protein